MILECLRARIKKNCALHDALTSTIFGALNYLLICGKVILTTLLAT